MSYDDDKRLVVGFGAGLIRLWGIVIFLGLLAALIGYASTALMIVVGIGLAIVLLFVTIRIFRRCKYVRANGRRCKNQAVSDGRCEHHLSSL